MTSGSDGHRKRAPFTELAHSGRDAAVSQGFVNPPVSRGSTVLYPSMADLLAGKGRYTYGRRGNPSVEALSTAVAGLEQAAGVVLVPSGLAAVTTAILSATSAGDRILVADSVYHPTRHFCDTLLARMGVEAVYYDLLAGAGIEALIDGRTRAIYMESPGSLTFEVQDVPAIVEVARRRGLVTVVDNTWATPLYFKPLAHGADISVHAGTKYLSGHSDVMIGTVAAGAAAWPALKATHGALGLCSSPDDAWLALRGLRTMGVRLAHQHRAGIEVARWLQGRPQVARVLHPALEDDPGHALWRRDFTGASGLFAVELTPGPREAVAAMLDGLELFGMGYSWGGFESLAIPFDAARSRTATRWAPSGPTLRIHVGLEDVSDLIADLEAGLTRFAAAA